MGILDEAIREHLELKRRHGAGDSELAQLEDEAFGQAERPGDEEAAPDPFAEAPTEFMAVPEAVDAASSRREPPTIADLQEPPPLPEEPAPVEEAPAEEEQPAMEHEVVVDIPETAEPEAEIEPAGPTTEERHAIAEQPTELHDMEAELGPPPSPTDEELVEEEIAEPRLAPADPLAGLEEDEDAEVVVTGPAPDDADDDEYEDEDDAFWNEQRLSDELDQALEAPPRDPEPERGGEVELDDEIEVELDEDPEPLDEPEAAAPRHDEDVLEETPDFLEETPEDDQLWFEQKPPKDFDFDD
jgi:CapZ-interacting protein